jgi:hypothetical protein
MPPTTEHTAEKAGEDTHTQASSLNIDPSIHDLQRLKLARSSFRSLDQDGNFKDRFKKIVAAAQARQKDRNLNLFIIGQENNFDPGDPATWPLYSPENVPEITPAAWYDPLGVFGFPAFVILDDRCVCVVGEKGFHKSLVHGTWCGNFNRDGDIWAKAAHQGHPAINGDGKILQMRFGKIDFAFIGNQVVTKDSEFWPISKVWFKSPPTNNVPTFKRSIISANEKPAEQQLQSSPDETKQKHASSELEQEEPPEPSLAADPAISTRLSRSENSMYLLLSTMKRLAEENLASFHTALKATDIIKEVSQIVFDKDSSLSPQERLHDIEILLLQTPMVGVLQVLLPFSKSFRELRDISIHQTCPAPNLFKPLSD